MRRKNILMDEDILQMLHLHENEGLKYSVVAERMGTSIGSVAGAIHRANKQSYRHLPPCAADGSMPPRWWSKRKSHS